MRGRQEAFFFYYLRCFDCRWVRVGGAGQKVTFVFSFLVLLKEMRIQGHSNPSPYFHSFRNLSQSQKLWKKSSKSTPTKIFRT